jgi:hypothetical protein
MTVVKIGQVVIAAVNGSGFIGFCATEKLDGVRRMHLVNEVRVLFKSGYAGKA